MSATLTPTAGAVALGVATLERLLGSKDERVALKAAELLLRLHPDLKKPKSTEDEPTEPLADAAVKQADAERTAKLATIEAARKVLLSPFSSPPAPPRSLDPFPASVVGGARPLTSFTNLPKSSPASPG